LLLTLLLTLFTTEYRQKLQGLSLETLLRCSILVYYSLASLVDGCSYSGDLCWAQETSVQVVFGSVLIDLSEISWSILSTVVG